MASELSNFEIELRALLEAIYLKYNYDFREYAFASIKRRTLTAQARMGFTSVSFLMEKVIQDAGVFLELLQYLTVPVSEMFRDPGYYRALRTHVIPTLRTYPSIRVWVAGCSTGEEAYSIAILLREEGLLERSLIYATDINPVILKRAQEGTFDLEAVRKFTVNYQRAGGERAFSDYYTADDEGVIIDPSLRKHIVFADHSLATDGVFSEMHLVSCRNVLIYFDRGLQERALQLFFDSLVYRGFLGLGSRETLKFSRHERDFDPVFAEEKLYLKNRDTAPEVLR